MWLRKAGEGTEVLRWVKNFRWHAKRNRDGQCCWLVKGLDDFNSRPYVEKRGRKRLLLPIDVRAKRLGLLRKRARIVQQIRTLMLDDDDIDNDSLNRCVKLGAQLESLKEEILPYGGVPKSWN
jgi:hypothetical protein